jgi:hypothetical protein
MDTARNSPDGALMSLESAATTARSGFACMFSTSDEYEHALISERRAQGHYEPASPGPWPMLMLIGCATAMVVMALLLD